jgi:hypothetical protein
MKTYRHLTAIPLISLALIAVFFMALDPETLASEAQLPAGIDIAEKINAKHFGNGFSQDARLELISKRGKSRNYQLRTFRKFEPDATYLVFFLLAPPDMKDTVFLCHDYFDGKRLDEQWKYKPSRKITRRIPESNRNETFLGSEFSVEDIKKINRVEINEYNWKTLEKKTINGRSFYIVEQVPITPELAKNIGYSRILNYVDSEYGIRSKIEFWDTDSNHLKTFTATEITNHNGTWLPGRITAVNLKTGCSSILHINKIDYAIDVPDEVFTLRYIEKGYRE